MGISERSDPDSIWNVGPFADGRRVVVIFPVSVADPDKVLLGACRRAYGTSFKIIAPQDSREIYESAYGVIRENLRPGEAMTLLNAAAAQVSFYTPTRPNKAWSAHVRIVDVSRFILN